MKLTAIWLSLTLFALAARAARFPLRRSYRHHHWLRSRSDPIYGSNVLASSNTVPDNADLSTVNDMIYIVNVTIGNVAYRLQLDTGSSDLWVMAPTSPVPNSNPTSTTHNLTYGIGWAFGHISYATVQYSGISVQKQAFLDVSNALNPAITYGLSGILGLGFTSQSTIDAVLTKSGSSSGRSLLYNLFSANPHEPNFVAISLQRSTDPTDDVQGTFLIGELDSDYAAVNQTSPIPTFPENNPTRWNVLLEAILIGNTFIPMTSTVLDAPSNNAVALLDSGSSYSYAPSEVCNAIYGNIPGAQLDSQTGLWSVPCNVEIDIALQFNGQVFPVQPLDVVPTSTTNPNSCVGSFVSQDISAIAAGNFDMIVGDNFLRSVYSVYDYGDFDKSGNMGNPYIKFLSLVNPNQASAEFASARGSVPRNNITYHAVNSTATVSGSNTVSLSDEIAKTLNKITTYFPIMLAVLGLNVLVILLLAIAAFIFIFRRRRTSSARMERKARRLTPYPLRVVSTDSFVPPPELEPSQPLQPRSLSHAYQPVSMALSEETFVPPSPAFHGGGPSSRSLDYRPKSVA